MLRSLDIGQVCSDMSTVAVAGSWASEVEDSGVVVVLFLEWNGSFMVNILWWVLEEWWLVVGVLCLVWLGNGWVLVSQDGIVGVVWGSLKEWEPEVIGEDHVDENCRESAWEWKTERVPVS